MFKAFVVLASVLCIVAGDNPYHAPAPYHPAPYHPEPSYHEPAKPYAFEYGVHDEYTGTNFNAQETTDGKTVHGSYNVQLPDGRLQTVTYTADDYNGFVADVKYEGKPHYDEYKPAPYKPAPPVYHKPAPVYHKPAPVYHKPAPIYHKPAPYRPAPIYHKPAPIYHKPSPYHPTPIYKPAPYHPTPVYRPYHG
ncbi:uncharacterized protein [Lepeophtheirus salmonis]|uniref:uncharacterized protein n=1 Tax=Lepeophtheirus salmonis TaxID=72036 RepID=UPI001AE253A1|nr:extensin-like [Lepeophtheirus salmonis]